MAKTVVAEIDISTVLDNEYILYDDGTYYRHYDRNQWSLNEEDTGPISEIGKDRREKLLGKCTEEVRVAVEAIFEQYPPKY
jgi:hypothetical protein